MTFEVWIDPNPELWDTIWDLDCEIIDKVKEMILDCKTNYIRLGECKRCGACCYVHDRDMELVPCKHLSFADDGLAICALYGKKNRPLRCSDFPMKKHLYKYPNCGYRWKPKS